MNKPRSENGAPGAQQIALVSKIVATGGSFENRPFPAVFDNAWTEFVCGNDGTDEEAALRLLSWLWIEEITHNRESAERVANELRIWWLNRSLEAIRNDPGFFRRIADLIESGQKQPIERKPLWFVYAAYMTLYQDPRHEPEQITKHQVKTLAKRMWAISRLYKAGKLTGGYQDDFSEYGENLLAIEISRLPEQRWQDFWKRPEFANLKEAPRGVKVKIVEDN